MHAELVLDALEHAPWTRQSEGVASLAGLVHHSDAGSQGFLAHPSLHRVRVEVDCLIEWIPVQIICDGSCLPLSNLREAGCC